MRIIICDNYDELSKKAAKIVASQITLKPDSVLGLATGSTPVGMYNELIKLYRHGELDFSEVKTFNLDEYYPIKKKNNQSYDYFMRENLFSKINIKNENIHIPNGETENPETECIEYEKQIKSSGGIDLQILGIGRNGHIGFNEPDATLNSFTHLTNLTENTIKANSRFFENEEEVPKKALTMGISTILNAKKIILLASGANKRKVVSELISGGINTNIPATMLKTHPDVVLICDRESYSGAKFGIDIGGTNIKMVTLALELTGSMDFIKNCKAVVSIGHTDCDYETAMEAIKNGAKCLTHTFNAMPPLHHRNVGPIGAAIDENIYVQVICDGLHLHKSIVTMLYRTFGADRMILISDSMRATGLSDGEYEFGGQMIDVKGGIARTKDGALAGSTSNLMQCVKKAIKFGIPKEDAIKMATQTPANLLGIKEGKIKVGYDADFVVIDDSMNVKTAIISAASE